MANLKTLSTIDTSPFKRLVLNLGATPTAFTEGMTYYEVLAWLCDYIEKQVVPTTNEAIEQFNVLKNYVETYFDNLDVQEEINNKLDEMAEDGTLDRIINQEIFGELTARELKYYDNIAELKAVDDTTLANGDYVATRGYNVKGDGGSAFYMITSNSMVGNDKDVLAIDNGLYAIIKPVNSLLNVRCFGIKGDNTTEEHENIQYAINYCNDNNLTCFFPAGIYLLNESIELASSHEDPRSDRCFDIMGENSNTVFKYTGSAEDNKELFIHDYAHNMQLKNLTWEGFKWSIIPNRIYTQGIEVWSNFLNKMNANLINLHGTGESYGMAVIGRGIPSTSRWGKGYTQYPLYIYNNSGYNGIEIDNFGNTINGEQGNPVDSSAIGIINRITNSAGIININNTASAPFMRLDKSDAEVTSTRIPGMVFEINPNGHVGIGCSPDFQEGNSSAGLKISDTNPAIALLSSDKYQIGSLVGYATSNDQSVSFTTGGSTAFITTHLNTQNYSGVKGKLKIISDGRVYYNGKILEIHDSTDNVNWDLALRTSTGSKGLIISKADNSQATHIQGVSSGATGSRPNGSELYAGFCYYDTTLNKPVWWNGSAWKDATGTTA